jgi:hypothetical protein
METITAKQEKIILTYLKRYKKINKAKAIEMGIFCLESVIKRLRDKYGYKIETIFEYKKGKRNRHGTYTLTAS